MADDRGGSVASSETSLAPRKVHERGSGWAVGCWIGILLVTFLGYLWVLMQMFSTVGCEGICHDEIIWATWATFPWLLFGIAALAVVTGLVWPVSVDAHSGSPSPDWLW